jgi:diguanylate cyclase (GGDEF)-like protein/PAS domain S-box-containing protein
MDEKLVKLSLLSIAFEAAANPVFISDTEGIIIWANEALCKASGYQIDELIGQKANVFKSEKHDADFFNNLWKTILSGQVWHGEIIIHNKDGTYRTNTMTISPVCETDGQITHFIAIQQGIGIHAEDKTETRTYAEQLQDKKRQEETIAQLTAEFNTTDSIKEVLDTLRRAIHKLGYDYLSTWKRYESRLYWDLDSIDLPSWLINEIPKVAVRFVKEHSYDIWVSLDNENIYSSCFLNQVPQTTKENRAILECLNIGKIAYKDLPNWVKQAGDKMMKRLAIQQHDAFPLGEYGIIFLSNPNNTTNDEHRTWINLILQQAHVAIARAQAIESLKESEKRYRALFERTNDTVLIISLDMTILAVNQQAADMLGYSVEELIGMPLIEIVAPEEWDDTLAKETKLRLGEIPPVYTRTFIRKDGKRVTAEVSVAMAYDTQGNPSHFQSIARDITERHITQDQLHLQAAALEAAANGILITDRQGTILWVNPAVSHLSGYSKSEIIGRNPNMFKSGENSQSVYRELWQAILNGEVWQGQLVNKRKDGSTYHEELTITPVYDSKGEITRFIAIKQDVSERVQVQKMLQHLATHDPLTDLPNRSLFFNRLEHAVRLAKRIKSKLAVMFIDLDDFKQVNDTYGHEIGDQLLQAIAQRLKRSVRESDTVARIGGDEFTILLEFLDDQSGAIKVSRNLLDTAFTPYMIRGHHIEISPSIGVSLYPDDSKNTIELVKFADQAMYAAKQGGKKNVRLYSGNQK